MKTTFKYDHYYDYEEIKNCLDCFIDKYPNLILVETNCITSQNRSQFVATLSNRKLSDPLDKAALYIDGNIHAGEVTSSMCAMHTIDYLLSNYESNEDIRYLLDNYTVYVIPRVSPDGAEIYLKTPYSLRSINHEYLPKKGGIRNEDLDNDGVIRMMAIPSIYGAFKKDNEGNMVLRSPSDIKGNFYDIYPEGILEKDDDPNLKNKTSDWGLDFNRNFPYGWFPEGRQEGAGKYPLSNTETKAIADFILAHPNICGAAIGHTSGGLILIPPGTRSKTKIPQSDNQLLKDIADMAKEELGYKPLNIFESFINSQEFYDSGALDDWIFESQGIPSYTMEFWDVSAKAGVPIDWDSKEKDIKHSFSRFNAIMKWVKDNAPQYYSDWKEYEHPDFGKVEIGGFNHKYTIQNPPENFLLNELEANTRFNIRFIKTLPHLIIDELKVNEIEKDIYSIDLTIGNTGFMPVNLTKTSHNIKAAKPIVIKLDNCQIISGKNIQEIEDLQGFSATFSSINFHGNISTEKSASSKNKLSWIVKAEKGQSITIDIRHPKAGHIFKTIII